MFLKILLVFFLSLQLSLSADETPLPKGFRQKRLLLITGCARSGTTYISEVLQQCGLDILHQDIGKDGASSWTMAVNSRYSPWGPSAHGTYFEHTFHQVRNPLKVISSVYANQLNKSWQFVYKMIPEIKKTDPLLVKSAKYWYYWNLATEKKAEWRYRIEDIDTVLPMMSLRLGIPLEKNALNTVPKDTNHKKTYEKQFTWNDLKGALSPELYDNIREMAKRYGYE